MGTLSTSLAAFTTSVAFFFLFFFKRLDVLQGILLEHHEKEFGNKVDTAEVLQAVKKIIEGN